MFEMILIMLGTVILTLYALYPNTTKIIGLFVLCTPLFLEIVVTKALALFFFRKLKSTKDFYWFVLGNKSTIRVFTVLEEVDSILGEAMPIKIQTNDVMNYVPLDCREDEKPSVIQMRRVPPLKSSKIKDTMYKVEGTKVIAGNLQTARTRMTIEALAGWKDVVDENENPVIFDPTNKELMFSYLPSTIQDELVAVFGDGSFNAEAEERLLNPDTGEDEEGEAGLDAELAEEEDSLSEDGTLQ